LKERPPPGVDTAETGRAADPEQRTGMKRDAPDRRLLVERAQRGDHEAYEVLTAEAFDRLYAVARRILRDADRTDDAVQECLVRAWSDVRTLRDPDRWEAWLFRLLVNACRDEGRRMRRRGSEIRVIPMERAAPGDAANALADRDQLERAFRRLNIDQRSVLVMHHYLGLRPAEIAETLGVPVGTIHSRLHYATSSLRALLEADARTAMAAAGGRTA
jgi:RNA polymerase sigma-70 factor (ECF subfamily)